MATWKPEAAKISHQLTFEGPWPSAVAFLDDDRLAAGNRDGQALLWNLGDPSPELTEQQQKDSSLKDRAANIHPQRQLLGCANGVTHLLRADGGRLLVGSSLDGQVRLWDVSAEPTGEAELVIDDAQRRRRIRRDKSNEQEVLGAPGIPVKTQQPQQLLKGHQGWVQALDLSADGSRLISGDDRGAVIVWDFPARKEINRWTGHPLDGVVSAALTADGGRAFVAEYRSSRGSFDRPPAQAKIFALDEGEMLVDLLVVKFPDVKARDTSYGYGTKWGKWVGRGFVASAFSPDGKLLAVGQGGEIGDAAVYLIDVETGKEVRTASKHKYGVTDVRFTADGGHLLTAGRDTQMRIVRVADGKEVAVLGKSRGGQFKDWFYAVDVSPSGNRLAAADIAGIVHVWTLS